jgi:SAM-dependent methyltransferase
MNDTTAKILCEINTDFYRNNSESFSSTREAPWPGWLRCMELLTPLLKDMNNLLILDLACGNLRFEKWLGSASANAAGKVNTTFYAVDNCDDLLPSDTSNVHYQNLDILDTVLHGLSLTDLIAAPPCDISVAFGFMHHIPSKKHRRTVLLALIEHTRPGGYVIVSFWQFLKNPGLREKAQVTHERALAKLNLPPLDDNDYLLGWKDLPDQFRYCHSFSETEIDELIDEVSTKTTTVARFVSDGRSNDLNTYVVLEIL